MSRTHRGASSSGGWFALATLFVAGPVAAQANPAAEAARRELIGQAQEAAASGDHARAMGLATRAGQLRMSPPLRRLIAEEQAASGFLIDALVSAEECVHETQADASLAGREQHLAACQALVARMNQRVGRVVVTVAPPAVEGVRITVAGRELPSALFGLPYAVTPGTVTIEASAPGRATIRREVSIVAGASASVGLDFSARAIAPEPVTTTPDVRATVSVAATPPLRTRDARSGTENTGSAQRTAGYVIMGLGAIGLVGGGVGALIRENGRVAFDGDASHCYVNATSGAIEARASAGQTACQSSAQSFATGNTLMISGLALGGVLVVAGLAVRLAAPSHSRDARQANWGCGPGPGDLGVVCAVAF